MTLTLTETREKMQMKKKMEGTVGTDINYYNIIKSEVSFKK